MFQRGETDLSGKVIGFQREVADNLIKRFGQNSESKSFIGVGTDYEGRRGLRDIRCRRLLNGVLP